MDVTRKEKGHSIDTNGLVAMRSDNDADGKGLIQRCARIGVDVEGRSSPPYVSNGARSSL